MVKLKTLWLLAGIGMVLVCSQLKAAAVPHLYDVTLVTQSQAQEEWKSLVKQGL